MMITYWLLRSQEGFYWYGRLIIDTLDLEYLPNARGSHIKNQVQQKLDFGDGLSINRQGGD